MSYYNEKRKALMEIKQLAIKQDENVFDIKNYILEKYAFGEKIVDNYLKILVERGILIPKIYECNKCGNLINVLTNKPRKCSCGEVKKFKLSK